VPLGGTLTVSPSARGQDPSDGRVAAINAVRSSGAGAQVQVPLKAKLGAAAGAAALTVVILVTVLRSRGRHEEETAAPAVTGDPTAATVSAAPVEPPPPPQEPAAAPVEGVIEMGEGDAVPESIASDAELMNQMDAGPGKLAPWIPPIPYGKARLIVTSKEGSCKVTVNAVPQGLTPVHIFVVPGKVRVYCRLQSGSTRSKEATVVRGRTTFVIFDSQGR
jgi:eukaryotic-like serine/threonine-protein kinase